MFVWDFLRSLFCRHEYRFSCNLYGDAAHQFDARSIWRCHRCGRAQFRAELHKGADGRFAC